MPAPSAEPASSLAVVMRDVEAIAFDLDGTLLDSVHDLAFALNRVFGERKLARIATSRVANLIGKGMPNLVLSLIHI